VPGPSTPSRVHAGLGASSNPGSGARGPLLGSKTGPNTPKRGRRGNSVARRPQFRSQPPRGSFTSSRPRGRRGSLYNPRRPRSSGAFSAGSDITAHPHSAPSRRQSATRVAAHRSGTEGACWILRAPRLPPTPPLLTRLSGRSLGRPQRPAAAHPFSLFSARRVGAGGKAPQRPTPSPPLGQSPAREFTGR
jgi:hypothetical protein